MKRHMKMSLVLVTLLLTLAILFTGCNSEELQTQIDDNKTEATNSIKDVAADVEAAEKALADAVKELKDLIAKGDKVDADALAAAITNVNAAIDAAEKAAEDADAELQDAIDAMIDDAEAAVEDAKAAWNDATDAIVAALAEIQKMEGDFASVKANYDADKAAVLENALDVAWVKVVRAIDADAVKAAMDELKEIFDVTPTITREIYNLLNDIAEGGIQCAPAEADDAAALAEVKDLIDDVKAGTNDVLKAELNAYDDGEEVIDLEKLYEDYMAAYAKAVANLAGAEIKAEMDAINATLMTPESELAATWLKYFAWESAAGNSAADVEGFEDTVDTYMDNMERVDNLVLAKSEAEALNVRIEAFATSVATYKATAANHKTMTELKADVNAWITLYFSGDYAVEIDPASVNYAMLNHAAFKDACDAFDAEVADAIAAANDFILAVENIGTVNLLSWDEIELAQSFYLTWIDAEGAQVFDFLFDEGKTPEDYFKTLVSYMEAFDALKANAYSTYVSAKATADTVNATNINLYSTELQALLAWYQNYTFVNGVAVFDNTTFADVEGFSEDALSAFVDVADGYKLAADLVVTADDYKALTDLKAVQEKLISDKNAETDALEAQIAAIGTVFVDADADKSTAEKAIVAARAAYATWKSGTDADEDGIIQNAVADGCTKFVVDNYNVLVAAEDKVVALKALATEIKAYIASLDYTDAGMDLADLPVDFDAATYLYIVEAINDAVETFTTDNGGIRGMITEEELAKLAAAELIVTKYNALAQVVATYNAKVAEVEANVELDADEKDDIKGLLATALNASKTLIEKATNVTTIESIVDRAEAEFDAVINGEILDLV